MIWLTPHIIEIYASTRGKYTTTQCFRGEMWNLLLHTGCSQIPVGVQTIGSKLLVRTSTTMTKTTCKKEIHDDEWKMITHNSTQFRFMFSPIVLSICRINHQKCQQRMLQMNSNETYRSEQIQVPPIQPQCRPQQKNWSWCGCSTSTTSTTSTSSV